MSDQLPDDAITAAIRAYNESYLTSNQSNPRFVAKIVTAVLEAAAPAIAAAEQERIRQLAIKHGAHYDCDPDYGVPFADLLDGAQ